MKTYEVTVRYTVTKTYTVEAENEEEAHDEVYDFGSPRYEADVPEDYDETVINVKELK